MIRISLVRPKKYDAVTFDRRDLLKIGAKAIQVVTTRVSRGVGLNDRRMKPLSPQWAAAKRKLGQPPIRNMMFSGSMLGAMTVVEAQDDRVMIGFTRQSENAKASANQDRTPWYGVSRNDEAVIYRYADDLLRAKLKK